MTESGVRVLQSPDEVMALGDEWDALSARFATPLLDHDWFATAAAALHAPADLRVVTIRQHGRLTAVAPMAVHGDRLTLLGSATLFEPGEWLYTSESSLQALTRAVVALGEVVVLDRVTVESAFTTRLPSLVRGTALVFHRDTAPTAFVPTNRLGPAPAARQSARTRRRLESARARASAMGGEVRYEIHHPGPGEVDEALDLLMRVEASGWKGRAGSALAGSPIQIHTRRWRSTTG